MMPLPPSYGRRLVRRARASTHRTSAGFTIVELLVAMVMLSIGILALAGTAGVTVRQLGGARQQILAANVAQARFEQLLSVGCTSISGGSATTAGVAESWTVTDSARSKFVVASVSYMVRGATRTQTFKGMIGC